MYLKARIGVNSMNSGLFVLLGFPATLLIAGVCLPDGWVHRRIGRFRQGVTWVAGLQVIVALSFLLASES